MKAGVVDPTKVTRYALQNVASIPALMLTAEALVTPSKKNPLRAAWITKPQHSRLTVRNPIPILGTGSENVP